MPNLSDLARLEPGSGGSSEPQAVWLQIEQLRPGKTQQQKPFFDLEAVDAAGRAKFKIWAETEAFAFCEEARAGDLCELRAFFSTNAFGISLGQPVLRLLTAEEREAFLAGPPENQEARRKDWDFLTETFAGLKDPRLKAVNLHCLEQFQKKWKRAAAARSFHHARRGGLLEHTSQMLRCAVALAPLYAEIFPDLLYTGVLFHDVGKLWENDYEGDSFLAFPSRRGELIGHISLGIEVFNRCWRECEEKEPEVFAKTQPPSDLVRDHALHLVASHHGQKEYGAPVSPRTPEAWMLHHIDNIDAKIEMLRCTYAEKREVVPGLYEARRPLEGLAARPLGEMLNAEVR